MNSTNANGSSGTNAQPVKTLTQTTNTEILSDTHSDDKKFSAILARFATLGHNLQVIRSSVDGKRRYIVSRWSHTRVFDDIADLEKFLVQIGGAHGI
jgi:hypothetical protein